MGIVPYARWQALNPADGQMDDIILILSSCLLLIAIFFIWLTTFWSNVVIDNSYYPLRHRYVYVYITFVVISKDF